ncbi:MAG TPA: ribonuclease HII [Clostridiales bacterium]|nr:ribonuclease HII [Clostridiales bacterium]
MKKIIDIHEKLLYENELKEQGYKLIAGVDEVGRGPLAGPVVCAAVVMPLDDKLLIDGVDDSKKVSEKKRKILAEEIKKRAVSYKICQVEADEIDELNILNATIKCMQEAVKGLEHCDSVIVDAVKTEFCVPSLSVIKGDAKSYNVGAASIIAKVYRDTLMENYALEYPEYGFEKHKGYGTKAHIDAIKKYGPCPIHRKTFIKNFV